MKTITRTFLLLLFMAGIATLGFSQGSQLGISLGLGLPTGDFGDEDENNAQPGWLVKGQFDYVGNAQFGFGGSVFYGQNAIDDDDTGADVSPYDHFGVFAGPLVAFGTDGFLFKVRAFGGIASTGTPEVEDGGVVIISEARASAFAFDIGAAAEFALSESVNLGFGLDYMSWEPEFEFDLGRGVPTIKEKERISLVTITGGLIFNLP